MNYYQVFCISAGIVACIFLIGWTAFLVYEARDIGKRCVRTLLRLLGRE